MKMFVPNDALPTVLGKRDIKSKFPPEAFVRQKLNKS